MKEQDDGIMHLAKITLAQLGGNAVCPDAEIMKAVVCAVEKEQEMSLQLYKSYLGNRVKFDSFFHVISGLVYDSENKETQDER